MPLSLKDTIHGTITNAQNAATADTAGKLSVNAGSTTQPVYFSGGIPSHTSKPYPLPFLVQYILEDHP